MDFIKSDLFKIIVLVVFCIINLVLVLSKKKPASNLIEEVFSKVIALLPGLISKVERPGNGSQKKLEVVEASLALMSKYLGRNLTEDEKIHYAIKFSNQIESILDAPTKKEEVK